MADIMKNYKFIRYGKKIIILDKDTSRCTDFDVVNQTKIYIYADSLSCLHKFFYEMIAKVDMRYIAKFSELLSDNKTMKISDLGLLWDAISKNYKLLEYDELDEQKQVSRTIITPFKNNMDYLKNELGFEWDYATKGNTYLSFINNKIIFDFK